MVDENKENLNRQRTVEDQTDQTVHSSNMTETKLTAILCKHFHHDATKTSLHAALCYDPGWNLESMYVMFVLFLDP